MNCRLHTLDIRRKQRGVGLIEVLVAVLILAFGILGLVGLQLTTLRNNESAFERGMAVVQTHSIADAMRADRETAKAGGFNLGLGAAAPTGTTFPQSTLANWRASLMAALGPTATGSVQCSNAAICTIVVQWSDQRGSGGDYNPDSDNDQQIQTQVEL